MSKGIASRVGYPKAAFITGTIRACVIDLRAHPYSINTFGFGVGRPSARLPTNVRSGTKIAAWSILRKIVSTIGGDPGAPFVSRSTSSSPRTASSMATSAAIRLTARSSARSIKLRPSRFGVSACQEKKTVRLMSSCGAPQSHGGRELRRRPVAGDRHVLMHDPDQPNRGAAGVAAAPAGRMFRTFAYPKATSTSEAEHALADTDRAGLTR